MSSRYSGPFRVPTSRRTKKLFFLGSACCLGLVGVHLTPPPFARRSLFASQGRCIAIKSLVLVQDVEYRLYLRKDQSQPDPQKHKGSSYHEYEHREVLGGGLGKGVTNMKSNTVGALIIRTGFWGSIL